MLNYLLLNIFSFMKIFNSPSVINLIIKLKNNFLNDSIGFQKYSLFICLIVKSIIKFFFYTFIKVFIKKWKEPFIVFLYFSNIFLMENIIFLISFNIVIKIILSILFLLVNFLFFYKFYFLNFEYLLVRNCI